MDLRQAVDQVLREDYELKLIQAVEEQKRIAQHYHNHRPVAREGIGHQVSAIHPLLDWNGRQIYGEAWDRDKDLRKWVLKQEEAFRVKAQSDKIMVGYSPASGSGRYHKTYA